MNFLALFKTILGYTQRLANGERLSYAELETLAGLLRELRDKINEMATEHDIILSMFFVNWAYSFDGDRFAIYLPVYNHQKYNMLKMFVEWDYNGSIVPDDSALYTINSNEQGTHLDLTPSDDDSPNDCPDYDDEYYLRLAESGYYQERAEDYKQTYLDESYRN